MPRLKGRQRMLDKCAECRAKLIEVATAGRTIYYSDLAEHLGFDRCNALIDQCRDAIYEEERREHRPDLTLVVISKETGLGRFNSRGKPAKSVRVNAKDK